MLFAVSVFIVWDKVQSWTNFSCHQIRYHKENDLWLGLLTRNTFYLGEHILSTNAVERGRVKKGFKSAVILYCLNVVGGGEGGQKDPKVAVIRP